MAVYVDNMKAQFRGMVMCHMWADTQGELLDMADKIGLEYRWLQKPPKADWVHFDIAQTKRALAIKNGAIETDKYGPMYHCAKLEGNTATMKMIEGLRDRANQKSDAGRRRA